MQEGTREIVFRWILVLVAALFLGGFFYQKHLDAKEAALQRGEQQEQKEKAIQESENVQQTSATEEKNQADLNLNAPDKDQGKTLSDLYSKEDIEASKQVSEEFVKALYPIDGNDLQKGINTAVSYANSGLAGMMKSTEGSIVRPTDDFYSRDLKDISIQEPDEVTSEFITWSVIAKGDVENKDGKVTDQDQTTYLLQLSKENNEYKVSDYTTIAE